MKLQTLQVIQIFIESKITVGSRLCCVACGVRVCVCREYTWCGVCGVVVWCGVVWRWWWWRWWWYGGFRKRRVCPGSFLRAPNWVAEHLGASSRRPRHPFSALMAEGNPGRVPVYTALPAHHEQAETIPGTCRCETTGHVSNSVQHRRCNYGT